MKLRINIPRGNFLIARNESRSAETKVKLRVWPVKGSVCRNLDVYKHLCEEASVCKGMPVCVASEQM